MHKQTENNDYRKLYFIGEYVRNSLSAFESNKEKDYKLLSLHLKIVLDSIYAHRKNISALGNTYDEMIIEAPHLIPYIRRLREKLILLEEKVSHTITQVLKLRKHKSVLHKDKNVEINYVRLALERLQRGINKIRDIDHSISFEQFNDPPALD